ncbi:hypothetical protein ACTWQB_16390 [Piscibacillus sp. B03]|uniref:hypothetical protein n=1 Tax=Piscibacillus sp. B03 TaxID=3457430 RepID=UPI003FCD45E2
MTNFFQKNPTDIVNEHTEISVNRLEEDLTLSIKDLVVLCYQEHGENTMSKMSMISNKELEELGYDVLLDVFHLIRELGWGKPSIICNLIISELADSTHNLPSNLSSNNHKETARNLAEYLCLISTFKQHKELLQNYISINIIREIERIHSDLNRHMV